MTLPILSGFYPTPTAPEDPAVVPRTLGLIYGNPYKGQVSSITGLAKRWRQLHVPGLGYGTCGGNRVRPGPYVTPTMGRASQEKLTLPRPQQDALISDLFR